MIEPLNNITGIDNKCAKERLKMFQKTFDKYSLEVGNFVKKNFKQGKLKEHMWVKITGIKNNSIIGILDNEPFLVKNVRVGDIVEVKFNEIEDLIK